MEKINLITVFFRRSHGPEDMEFESKLALSYMWFLRNNRWTISFAVELKFVGE